MDHFKNNHCPVVRAAGSSNQLYDEMIKAFQAVDFKTTKTNDLNIEKHSGSTKSDLIQMLNDDCLENICKKLALRDQINFSQICRRFNDVFLRLSKVQYKMLELDMMDDLTLFEKHRFLKVVGPNIKSMKGKLLWNDFQRVMKFIARYCIYIECLNTEDIEFLPLVEKMDSCMKLELQYLPLNDSFARTIKCLPNLKILRLKNCGLSGNHIGDLVNIEELSLQGCHYIESIYFKQIFQNLTNLHTLDIRNCMQVNISDFKAMVHHLHKLEDLKIRNTTEQYECIAQLPKLKRLSIAGIGESPLLCHKLLVELVKYKSEKLEELMLMGHKSLDFKGAALIGDLKNLKKLSCPNNKCLDDMCLSKLAQLTNLEDINLRNCINITNEALFNLLQKCPKLNRINFLQCKLITDKFIYAAFKLIKEEEKTTQRKLPVLLLANRINVRTVAINRAKLKLSSDLLKVCMDYYFFDEYEGHFDYEFNDYVNFNYTYSEYDNVLEDIYVDMGIGVFRPKYSSYSSFVE